MEGLSPDARAAIDRYWADSFGCAVDALRPAAPLVLPHARELADYAGAYLQTFGAAPVISLPPSLVARHGERVAEAAAGGLVDDGRWRAVFGDAFDRVVGPAEIRYADAGMLRATESGLPTRLLTAEDAGALAELERACGPEDWEQAGGMLAEHRLAGVFAERSLAAVAGYEVWGGAIAHISVVTHPAHRGRGYGAAAVSFLAREALGRGLVAQHRALAANAPSIAVANRLGFRLYATSIAIRLRIA